MRIHWWKAARSPDPQYHPPGARGVDRPSLRVDELRPLMRSNLRHQAQQSARNLTRTIIPSLSCREGLFRGKSGAHARRRFRASRPAAGIYLYSCREKRLRRTQWDPTPGQSVGAARGMARLVSEYQDGEECFSPTKVATPALDPVWSHGVVDAGNGVLVGCDEGSDFITKVQVFRSVDALRLSHKWASGRGSLVLCISQAAFSLVKARDHPKSVHLCGPRQGFDGSGLCKPDIHTQIAPLRSPR
jgi:hypothetical protein